MASGEETADAQERVRYAERLKFFTDAVVAIAMTLLILPLMEAVSEAATSHLDTIDYLNSHRSELFAFALSFTIIASFWVSHERLFSSVEVWTGPLMVLNLAWMLTIVLLPVATAIAGRLDTDPLQVVIYIGTMLLSRALMAAMDLVVLRTPAIWGDGPGPDPRRLTTDVTLVVLFGAAMLLAVLVPTVGYLALLLLLANGPAERLLSRALFRRRG